MGIIEDERVVIASSQLHQSFFLHFNPLSFFLFFFSESLTSIRIHSDLLTLLGDINVSQEVLS